MGTGVGILTLLKISIKFPYDKFKSNLQKCSSCNYLKANRQINKDVYMVKNSHDRNFICTDKTILGEYNLST